MAKKKKKAAKKKGKRGPKTCSKCGKVQGIRAAKCSKCNAPFTTQATLKKKKGKAATAKPSAAIEQIQAASSLVRLAGGSNEAKAIIDALNQPPF